jgi:hypothetical protein
MSRLLGLPSSSPLLEPRLPRLLRLLLLRVLGLLLRLLWLLLRLLRMLRMLRLLFLVRWALRIRLHVQLRVHGLPLRRYCAGTVGLRLLGLPRLCNPSRSRFARGYSSPSPTWARAAARANPGHGSGRPVNHQGAHRCANPG